MAHSFSDDDRKRLAKQGKAMSDGGYPIRNREDLVNAVRAYGRGNNKEEVKKWIKKRAKELDAEQYLPDDWQVDDEDSLAHHGIKGMKWGVRRKRDEHNKSYTDKQRKERSEKRKKTARKVRREVSGAAVTVGSMVVSDMIFNQGMGTKAAVDFGKAAVRTGMNMVNNMKNVRYNQADIPLRPWEYEVR